jgi:hypothetical protein
VGSVAYGSGVGKDRVIRWDLRSQAFGVHASAASFNDLSMASPIMGHLGLGVAMVQAQVITPVGASMGHLAENIYNMGVANATHGHTVAAPAQTSLQQLVVVAADQGHTATPNVMSKVLLGANADMGHEATPDTLAKVVLAANATQGHTATPVPIGLTVVNATMGHNGLAVEFPTGGAANLTVVAGTMPHDGQGVEGFSPTQLPDLQLWLAPESGVDVSGDRVLQWNDKSVNQIHIVQASVSSAPIHVSGQLNGHNVVRFHSNNLAFMQVCAASQVSAVFASALSPFVGVMVLGSSTPAVQSSLLMRVDTGGSQLRTVVTSGLNQSYSFRETVGATTSAVTVVSAFSTAAHVFRWSWTSGNVAAWQNGAQILATAKVSAGSNTTFGSAARFLIGRAGASQYIGDIAEVIVASTAWSSSQGRELDKLLGAKYGIAIT